jgi:hypothetical protein
MHQDGTEKSETQSADLSGSQHLAGIPTTAQGTCFNADLDIKKKKKLMGISGVKKSTSPGLVISTFGLAELISSNVLFIQPLAFCRN